LLHATVPAFRIRDK